MFSNFPLLVMNHVTSPKYCTLGLGSMLSVHFGVTCHVPSVVFPHRQLKKLSEDSLTKQPEEVFDVLEKLGEG